MKPEWKRYEDSVYDLFVEKYPDHTFQRDMHVVGRITGVRRQIDIGIQGNFLGQQLFVVVDCKCYTRKIHVKDVESFIGFLKDVGADFGVLTTNAGFTRAAKKQARASNVKLDIVTYRDLKKYQITFYRCEECDPGEDRPSGTVLWCQFNSVIGDVDEVEDIGRCDWCNTIHIQCLTCGEVTGIPDVFYGESVKCTGGCGAAFVVERDLASKGLLERLTVHASEE